MNQLFTIGHSNLDIETFIYLLQQHGITAIADVRSHPYSRRFSHFSQPALKASLLDAEISVVEFSVRPLKAMYEGSQKWEGTIVTENQQQLTTNITDPVFIRKLDLSYRPQNHCLVTVSLSMPWRPENWEGGDPCWKLIAGVVELPDSGNRKTEINDEYDEIPF